LSRGNSSNAITLGFSTASAGTVSGTVTLGFESDGTGIDGLGITNLGNQTVDLNATVNNYAVAAAPRDASIHAVWRRAALLSGPSLGNA